MFLGVAIGDALGMPVETMTAEEIESKYGRVTAYIQPDGHKWFDGLEAGTWTDDTQLTLAVARSLIKCGRINVYDIQKEHAEAYVENHKYWGKTTRQAIENFMQGKSYHDYGVFGGAGNGVLMKMSPLALYYFFLEYKIAEEEIKYDNIDPIYNDEMHKFKRQIDEFCLMTHKSSDALYSANIYFPFVFSLAYDSLLECITGLPQEQIPSQSDAPAGEEDDNLSPMYYRVHNHSWRTVAFSGLLEQEGNKKPPMYDKLEKMMEKLIKREYQSMSVLEIAKELGTGSYVGESMPFVLASILSRPLSIELLYDVVNAGGDTDTNGSMIGAMIGITLGEKGLPEHLVNGLWRKDEIIKVADAFCDRFFK